MTHRPSASAPSASSASAFQYPTGSCEAARSGPLLAERRDRDAEECPAERRRRATAAAIARDPSGAVGERARQEPERRETPGRRCPRPSHSQERSPAIDQAIETPAQAVSADQAPTASAPGAVEPAQGQRAAGAPAPSPSAAATSAASPTVASASSREPPPAKTAAASRTARADETTSLRDVRARERASRGRVHDAARLPWPGTRPEGRRAGPPDGVLHIVYPSLIADPRRVRDTSASRPVRPWLRDRRLAPASPTSSRSSPRSPH